jgi:ABC-2 type transport system permease protein
MNAILNAPFVRQRNSLRTFLVATWLGWHLESNWTSPFLFAIYAIARPIASVLILVVMYSVITDGALEQPIFAYIYLGNSLYILVGQVISGVSMAVVEDREHYGTTKQLHTSPINGYAYLVGRGVARLLIGLVSVAITVGFGIIAFKLPLSLATIDWPLLLFSTVFGLAATAALGIMIGAVTYTVPRHIGAIGEMIAGALYLFTGAIFPLDVLPAWLQPIGFIFPVTYWLEAARRALLGPNAARFQTLAGFSDVQLVLILVVSTVVLGALSVWVYRWAIFQAKERGMLDMESSY